MRERKRTVHVTLEIETTLSTKTLRRSDYYLDMLNVMEGMEIRELKVKNTKHSLNKAEVLLGTASKICGSVKVNVSG